MLSAGAAVVADVLAAQLSEKPAALSTRRYDVPKRLSDLISQCLEKEPARRPDSASSVLRTLRDPATFSGVFDAPVSARRRWQRSRGVLVTALLLSVAVATWMWSGQQSGTRNDTPPVPVVTPPPIASQAIAVLPLESVGNDGRARDVAAGIASELTNAMAGIAGLRVTSLASASAIRDRLRASTDGTQPLDVALLLEGIVQRERNMLRVTVRLVQAARDSTTLAQVFQGSADSVLQYSRRSCAMWLLPSPREPYANLTRAVTGCAAALALLSRDRSVFHLYVAARQWEDRGGIPPRQTVEGQGAELLRRIDQGPFKSVRRRTIIRVATVPTILHAEPDVVADFVVLSQEARVSGVILRDAAADARATGEVRVIR
ncbi:MAG: hypothetical protein ACT4P6_19925 [Gemmatimonadaceae bacterium]